MNSGIYAIVVGLVENCPKRRKRNYVKSTSERHIQRKHDERSARNQDSLGNDDRIRSSKLSLNVNRC